jgi:5-methylcytosine-specific restriction endonuclease McrA
MADHAEEQRRLDDLRQQALLAEYRGRPYAERRQTKEWAILKKQVHRRDGYRCRLCGRADVQLHVHHRTYETYAEERLEDLMTPCRSCHEHFHFLSEAS